LLRQRHNVALGQNRRQEVFNKGGLTL